MTMKEVAISEFKAKCLALLSEVEKTKQPLQASRVRGSRSAEVAPPTPVNNASWIGSMKDRIQIHGDIVSPAKD